MGTWEWSLGDDWMELCFNETLERYLVLQRDLLALAYTQELGPPLGSG